MTSLDDVIVREYISLRNMKVVSKKLGIPIGEVRKVILSRCGVLYGFPGLCRAYLYISSKCYASSDEVAEALRTTHQNTYYIFYELSRRNVGLKLAVITNDRMQRYLVWDREECVEELRRFIYEKERGRS